MVLATIWSGALLILPLDPDYTAGELLDHLMGWSETGILYPALGEGPTLRVLNYPPLVLLAARGLTALGLPPLAAGRIINGLGLLVLLGAVAGWARARGARGAVLAGTVGLLGASFPLLYGAGQFHIELWAAAGTVAGFALLDRGRGEWTGAAAGAALAMACFVKQTQVIPGLVALVFAWRYRRHLAPGATATFASLGVMGSLGITAAWGLEPWRHMLTYTVGTFSLANLGLQLVSYAAPWIVFMVFAVHTLRRQGAGAWRDPLVWYGGAALAWSLAAAREGASYPYYLELHLCLALWVGPRMFAPAGERMGRVWSLLLAAQVIGADIGTAAALGLNVHQQTKVASVLDELCAPLLQTPGPILTEEAGLARACGRPARIHPFILSSLNKQGLWDDTPFVQEVDQGRYGAALLPFDPTASDAAVEGARWTPAMLQAFRRARRVDPAPAGLWWVRW